MTLVTMTRLLEVARIRSTAPTLFHPESSLAHPAPTDVMQLAHFLTHAGWREVHNIPGLLERAVELTGGSHFCTGEFGSENPCLEVTGFGVVGVPVNEIVCEELRSECKQLRRKTAGSKDELQCRLLEVYQQNDKGWKWHHGQSCTKERYLASGECRHVYSERYTKGPRKGEYCVWKVFKTGSVYESKFFQATC